MKMLDHFIKMYLARMQNAHELLKFYADVPLLQTKKRRPEPPLKFMRKVLVVP
jgi:hypothetical protein